MIKFSLNIITLLLYISSANAQPAGNEGPFIARVGNMFISEQEFLKRYELLPGAYRNRPNNVEESKLVFLYSMVAEKLLAQEASDRHLDQDSGFLKSLDGIRKMLVRDELYREEISGKVVIPKAELHNAIVDARRTLFLSFLYFDDSTDAAFVRKQLKNCKQFRRFQVDTAMAVIRDTATLRWGEAEAPIEEAGFRLKKGECSDVVKASTGYYILYVEKESPNPFYISMQPDVLVERVEAKLRLRKEKALLDEYVQNILRAKTGFSLPGPLKTVAQTLNTIWKEAPAGSEQMITDSLLEILQERCRSILRDSMVVAGSSCWTVEEVLSKLRGKIFTVDRSRTTGIASQLNEHLRIIVQQDLLAEEALSRKLDERWSVKNELDIWRQQIMAKYEEMEIQKNIRLSDQEIMNYISETTPGISFPRVQIRELHTRTLPAMEHAISEMGSGSPLEEIIHKYSTDAHTAQNGGLSGTFAINERPPLGAASWKMNIGERFGPLQVNDDYIFFELVKKDLPSGITDSAFNVIIQKGATALRPIKQKKILDAFIAQSARQRGYDIYMDRLKLLKVASAPMMTYRILGFGGRMFAVPFVSRHVDWINVTDPEKVLVP